MKTEKIEKGKAAFSIDSKSTWAQTAMILMLLSAIFRLIGSWGQWTDSYFAATQIVLPICCNLLFALCIFAFGRKGFWLSSIPMLLGVVFFVIKAFGFENWIHTVLCIILYLLVAIIYIGTVFGAVRTKWLLPPLFGLPFLYHVLVQDLTAMQDAANPVTLSAGMLEISVLCIMAALFCTSMGLKKRKPDMDETELPKIKDPVVLPPEKAKTEPSAVPDNTPETSVTPITETTDTAAIQSETGESGEAQ